jgi:hypothetical protein
MEMPEDLAVHEPLGNLEPVAFFNGAMPTGVTKNSTEEDLMTS